MNDSKIEVVLNVKKEDLELLKKYGYDFKRNFECLVVEVANGIRNEEKRNERKVNN